MEIFSVNNILFSFGENHISFLEFAAVIVGLSCVFLAGRNNKYTFWLGYIYNFLLFFLFLQKNLYSAMLLQPIAFGINAFGHWRWTHPKKEEESISGDKSLKVTGLNWEQRLYLLFVISVSSAVWGLVLSKLGTNWFAGIFRPDPKPFLDSTVLMFTLAAQYLSAQKKWDCWILWLIVNLTNITLYISANLVFMPIVSGLYLLNGIWALWTWFRLYKKEN